MVPNVPPELQLPAHLPPELAEAVKTAQAYPPRGPPPGMGYPPHAPPMGNPYGAPQNSYGGPPPSNSYGGRGGGGQYGGFGGRGGGQRGHHPYARNNGGYNGRGRGRDY